MPGKRKQLCQVVARDARAVTRKRQRDPAADVRPGSGHTIYDTFDDGKRMI
jgi:hypothetical protein